VRQSEPDAAIDVLLEGSRQFRSQWSRPQAIHLLRRARAIDPWHFETVLELALHLGRADQQAEASMLLEGLAERCQERSCAACAWRRSSVAPGARSLLRWLTSWRGRERADARAARPDAGPRAPRPVLTLARGDRRGLAGGACRAADARSRDPRTTARRRRSSRTARPRAQRERTIVRRGVATAPSTTSTNAALGIVAVSDSEPIAQQTGERAATPPGRDRGRS
jgi:hypothetical protein